MEEKVSKNHESIPHSKIFIFGLLMGTADAVPGVSGGTIALIIGIYRRLIISISDCLIFVKNRFPSDSRLNFFTSVTFLFPLGLGMLCAYYVVTKILVGPDDSPGLLREDSTGPYIFAFFFGLVLLSVREPWALVSNPESKHYVLAIFGILIILTYSSFNLESESSSFLLILGGALALTAMLLPGVSGALVLLTLGQYTAIASSFHDGELEPLFFLIIGGIIGLITFVPFMNYMMTEYIDTTMALLTGLMCGSLITLWPWKENYDVEGLSPNLGLAQVFDNFTPTSLFLTFLFFGAGMLSSYGLKHFDKKET
jgi:putative membrane protein